MNAKEPRLAIAITMGSLLPKRNLVNKYKGISKKSNLHQLKSAYRRSNIQRIWSDEVP